MTYRTSFTATSLADREETIVDGRFSSDGSQYLTDSEKINLGTDEDIKIYHGGDHAFIENTTGDFLIRNSAGNEIKIQAVSGNQSIVANAGGSVDLHHDGSGTPHFQTTGSGAKVTGQLEITTASNSFITSANVFKGTASQKGAYIRSATSSAAYPTYANVDDTNTGIHFPGSDVLSFSTGGTDALSLDASQNATFAGDVFIDGDSPNSKLIIGDGGDVEFYHYSGHNYIDTLYSSKLLIRGAGVEIKGANQSDKLADFLDAGCKLYFGGDSTAKFETFSSGVKLNGQTIVTQTGTTAGGNYNLALKNTHASNDYSLIYFQSTDTGSNTSSAATIRSNFTANDSATNGKLELQTRNAGTLTTALTLNETQDAIFAKNVSVGGTTHGFGASLSNIWLGATGNLYSETAAGTGNSLSISQNAHVDSDGSWEYIHGDKAANIYLYNGTWGFRTAAAGVAGNNITWSETLLLNHDGNAEFSGNIKMAATKGVQFSAYDEDTTDGNNISSNTLDDYEEGTFVPAMAQGVDDGSGGDPNYSLRGGHYTKIGNRVHAEFFMYFGAGTVATGATYKVGGLPFSSKNATYIRGGGCTTFVDVPTSGAGSDAVMAFYGAADSTVIEVSQGSVWVKGTDNDTMNGKYFIGFYEYIAT